MRTLAQTVLYVWLGLKSLFSLLLSGRLRRAFVQRLGLAVLLVLALPGVSVRAHEILPAIVDLSFDQSGQYVLDIEVNLEALIAKIGPEHADTDQSDNAGTYDELRAFEPLALEEAFVPFAAEFLSGLLLKADRAALTPEIVGLEIPAVGDLDLARQSVIRLQGNLPPDAETFTWGWASSFGASIIRVAATDQHEQYSAYLAEGQASEPLAITGVEARSTFAVATNYMAIGFTHIVPKGLDHILFVVGLFLLSTRLHALLWQITAFTVAHTVTLALGVTGLVSIPANIVEPLIALSIVYVGVENIFSSRLTRWRPAVVFGFGLLHGLGFAGVLQEIGLSANDFVIGLISFNVGVELGQLSVIAACFLLVGFWFQSKPWYRAAITIPASVVIALIATWWFFERAVFA